MPPKPATVVPAGMASTANMPRPLAPAGPANGERAEPRLAHGHLRVGERSEPGLGEHRGPAQSRNRTATARSVRSGQNIDMSKRRERERLVRRRVASERRGDDGHRPPVRAGHLSPRRSVPADIPRPPYAPDAPRSRSGGAARRDPRAHARRGPRRARGAARGRRRGRGRASRPTSSTASATRRTSRGAATRARSTTRATRSRCARR